MKKLILITILTFALSAKSQESVQNHSFSLEEAIAHALTNNYSAINAGRDIEVAKKKKWETTAMGLPQISAGLDYQNYLKQPVILADFNQDGARPAHDRRHRQTVRRQIAQHGQRPTRRGEQHGRRHRAGRRRASRPRHGPERERAAQEDILSRTLAGKRK